MPQDSSHPNQHNKVAKKYEVLQKTDAAHSGHLHSLGDVLKHSSFAYIVARHHQSKKLQQELDVLLSQLALPGALVSPGKKNNEYLLNVRSAAEATLLRNQIPKVQLRLKPRLNSNFNNLILRIRNRPSVTAMRQRNAPRLAIPDSVRRKFARLADNLTHAGLRKSIRQLLDIHDN